MNGNELISPLWCTQTYDTFFIYDDFIEGSRKYLSESGVTVLTTCMQEMQESTQCYSMTGSVGKWHTECQTAAVCACRRGMQCGL